MSSLTALHDQCNYIQAPFCASEGRTISKDPKYSDCVILDKETFDPEAVFHEDIVADEVLPKLSLAVDGLTSSADRDMELPSEDTAKNKVIKPSKVLPETTLDPEELEVYGWESSLWKKIRGYLGF